MRTKLRACAAFALLAAASIPTQTVRAQTPPTDPKTERLAAVNLEKQQNWLAALPIFEDLYVQNPKDIFVLEGLAQSLIARAVTQTDVQAAGKDRLRARDLLLSAKELGDQSPLSQNLRGDVTYAADADVNTAMKAGEAAFARHNFDEAIKNYSHALELDPKSYHAALFVGDSYFATKKFPEAGEWYDRATKINPNIETAYRYHADMLTKQGDFAGARIQAIEAVVAEPYNAVPLAGAGGVGKRGTRSVTARPCADWRGRLRDRKRQRRNYYRREPAPGNRRGVVRLQRGARLVAREIQENLPAGNSIPPFAGGRIGRVDRRREGSGGNGSKISKRRDRE
jgi:tetratricopeptide (TPR) repeat protein